MSYVRTSHALIWMRAKSMRKRLLAMSIAWGGHLMEVWTHVQIIFKQTDQS
jgi:hypothetical protein